MKRSYTRRTGASEQQDIPSDSQGKTLAERHSGEGVQVEPVTNMSTLELEKFMHEPVVIYIHPTKEKGALETIVPNVNDSNQPIVRGVKQTVKRKYVEALIWAHSVEYVQKIDPYSPDKYSMIAKPTPSYPFDVIEDSLEGQAWKARLEKQLAAQVR